MVYNHGEFIRKIYDSDLFLKNLREKTTHPSKNANRFFYVQSRPPPPQKNLFLKDFFLKNVYYSILYLLYKKYIK